MADRIDEIMKSDERFNPEKNPMPFDGARMIYGGFDPVVQEGASTPDPSVQGFILPVSEGDKEASREAATGMWAIMTDNGATRLIKAWKNAVHMGTRTDCSPDTKAGSRAAT